MKTLLFAAALMLGTAAIAQDATTTDSMQDKTAQPSGETVDDPSQSTGPEGTTQQGTVPDGTGMAPAGTNQPMSAPMTAPMPMEQSSMPGAMAPQAAAGEYPACSRTVTDRCIQTYERGVRRAARRPRR